ncbi:MAG: PEP-CTERM sorting domain-containing protein [Puniceicoccales bacterium]|jgi:hypothetical protein|nr:PEP-CTERM sorting domain-containing protein [Puniceicoccales bacterium]
MKTMSSMHAKPRLGFLNAAAASLLVSVAITPPTLQADAWLYDYAGTLLIDTPYDLTQSQYQTAVGAVSDRITGTTSATVVRVDAGGGLFSDRPFVAGLEVGFIIGGTYYKDVETWRPTATQYGKLEIINGGTVTTAHSSIGHALEFETSPPPLNSPAHGEVLIGSGSSWTVNGWLSVGMPGTTSTTYGSTGKLTLAGGNFEATAVIDVDVNRGTFQNPAAIRFGGPTGYISLLPVQDPISTLTSVALSGYAEFYQSSVDSYAHIGTADGAPGKAGTLAIRGYSSINPEKDVVFHQNSTYIRTVVSSQTLATNGGIRMATGGHLDIVNGAKLEVQVDEGFSLTGSETIRVAAYSTYALSEWFGDPIGNGYGFNDGASQIAVGGYLYDIQYNATGIDLVGTGIAIPEPSTYALLGGIGAVALALLRRRRGSRRVL